MNVRGIVRTGAFVAVVGLLAMAPAPVPPPDLAAISTVAPNPVLMGREIILMVELQEPAAGTVSFQAVTSDGALVGLDSTQLTSTLFSVTVPADVTQGDFAIAAVVETPNGPVPGLPNQVEVVSATSPTALAAYSAVAKIELEALVLGALNRMANDFYGSAPPTGDIAGPVAGFLTTTQTVVDASTGASQVLRKAIRDAGKDLVAGGASQSAVDQVTDGATAILQEAKKAIQAGAGLANARVRQLLPSITRPILIEPLCDCWVTAGAGGPPPCEITSNVPLPTNYPGYWNINLKINVSVTMNHVHASECKLIYDITYLGVPGSPNSAPPVLGSKREVTSAGQSGTTSGPTITIRRFGNPPQIPQVPDPAPAGTVSVLVNVSGMCRCDSGPESGQPISCKGFSCSAGLGSPIVP